MEKVEAIALDDKHLELKKPLSKYIGKHFFINILSSQEERSHLLRLLKKAYMSMNKEDRKEEVEIAEEGLKGQPNLEFLFPNEKDDKWWE